MLYTLGTSNRSLDEFVGEAIKRNVTRMIDVRSKPYSRNQHFNRPFLESACEEAGIVYQWRGKILGGMNEIRTDDEMYVSVADRLIDLMSRHSTIIFCSEGDPKDCHRSWKVGSYLLKTTGEVTRNILRSGEEEDITRTLLRTKADNIPECLRKDALALARKLEGK